MNNCTLAQPTIWNELTDADWVRILCTNDAKAWRMFTNLYRHTLLKAIGYYLYHYNRYSEANKNDMYGILLVKLFDNNFRVLRSYQCMNGASLITYLTRIIRNACISHARSYKRYVTINEEHYPYLKIVSSEYEGHLAREHVQRLLATLKKRLNPQDWILLELFYLRKLTVDTISRNCSTTQANIYMKLSRVRKKARKALGENDCYIFHEPASNLVADKTI